MAVKTIFGLHAFTGCDTMRENKASENLNKKSQIHNDVFWYWSNH